MTKNWLCAIVKLLEIIIFGDNMIELPEAITLAKQINACLVGKTVKAVLPPTKLHKFCWFNGDPLDYESLIISSKIVSGSAFGIFVEIAFDNGQKLCFDDGVIIRYYDKGDIPKDYQLAIQFSDGSAVAFTVAMYGGIALHDGNYDNVYYQKSKQAILPFSSDYTNYYYKIMAESKPNLSAKAFLATEQRFPGIGNGVLQDILYNARLSPKTKIGTLTDNDKAILLSTIISTLKEMTDNGGRDTEKDLYGNSGNYITKLSRLTANSCCRVCGGPIIKEAYLGGAVYYCPKCQK